MNLAQEAYEAYAKHTQWKSLATGQPLPPWEQLPEAIRTAWTVSTAWVVGRVNRSTCDADLLVEVFDVLRRVRAHQGCTPVDIQQIERILRAHGEGLRMA